MVLACLETKNLRSVIMASNRVAFFHTGLDASDTITSKYMSSVPYCRRLALMFSSGPRHFWFFLLDLPGTWMKKMSHASYLVKENANGPKT